MDKFLRYISLIVLLLLTGAVGAQNNVGTVQQAGIIIEDSAQQIFVIMPQGEVQFKPIDIQITVSIDEDKDVAHVTTNVRGRRVQYRIYDSLGNEVVAAEADGEKWDIDISALAAGLYILQVSDGTRRQRHRIVKNE